MSYRLKEIRKMEEELKEQNEFLDAIRKNDGGVVSSLQREILLEIARILEAKRIYQNLADSEYDALFTKDE